MNTSWGTGLCLGFIFSLIFFLLFSFFKKKKSLI